MVFALTMFQHQLEWLNWHWTNWRGIGTRLRRLTWAIRTPVMKLMFPFGWTKCILDKMRPTSLVRVARTSTVLQLESVANEFHVTKDQLAKSLTSHMSTIQHCFRDWLAPLSCQLNWCRPSARSSGSENNHHFVGNHCCQNCNSHTYTHTSKFNDIFQLKETSKRQFLLIFHWISPKYHSDQMQCNFSTKQDQKITKFHSIYAESFDIVWIGCDTSWIFQHFDMWLESFIEMWRFIDVLFTNFEHFQCIFVGFSIKKSLTKS